MINLIPMPSCVKETDGVFSFDKQTATIHSSKELCEICDIANEILSCNFKKTQNDANLVFETDLSLEEEAYSLCVSQNNVKVYASSYKGAFYALESLRQLFESDIKNKKRLTCRCLEIKNDCPKYSWRGLSLDESRHFFGKDTVKKLLDFMAMYKLNVFHWHLTDDQGFRIESKKYPLLTQIGSKRLGTQLKNWRCAEMDMSVHEGFYTQEDIKEIVEYARKRAINILPEVDFPAHSAAAIASYNNLACREISCQVHNFFGDYIPRLNGIYDSNRTLCLGKENVYRFVFDILDEVSELFPFEYFHIGGDEAPTNEWKKCPECQKKIKEEHLKNEVALQGYFTNKLNEHLKSKGKTLIGWNEVLKAKLLDKDVVAQYWTPKKDKNITKHIKNGGKIIMSCHSAFYFDMPHTQTTVKNAYHFNPLNHNVPKEYLSSVLGVEGENWTEWTDSEDQLFFKLSCRTLALSENAWSSDCAKDYVSFCQRLQRHKYFLSSLGIYCGENDIIFGKRKGKNIADAKLLGISLADYDAEYKIDKHLKSL